VVEQARTLYRL